MLNRPNISIRLAIVSVIAGAMLNLMVAYSSQWLASMRGFGPEGAGEWHWGDEGWSDEDYAGGREPDFSLRGTTLGVTYEIVEYFTYDPPSLAPPNRDFSKGGVVTDFSTEVLSFGWPMRSLKSTRRFRKVTTHPPANRNGAAKPQYSETEITPPPRWYHRGIDFNKRVWITYAIPIAVRPFSFVINTLFYGSLLLIGRQLYLFGRATLRTRRGLCAACKYPLGKLGVCPECGTVRD